MDEASVLGMAGGLGDLAAKLLPKKEKPQVNQAPSDGVGQHGSLFSGLAVPQANFQIGQGTPQQTKKNIQPLAPPPEPIEVSQLEGVSASEEDNPLLALDDYGLDIPVTETPDGTLSGDTAAQLYPTGELPDNDSPLPIVEESFFVADPQTFDDGSPLGSPIVDNHDEPTPVEEADTSLPIVDLSTGDVVTPPPAIETESPFTDEFSDNEPLVSKSILDADPFSDENLSESSEILQRDDDHWLSDEETTIHDTPTAAESDDWLAESVIASTSEPMLTEQAVDPFADETASSITPSEPDSTDDNWLAEPVAETLQTEASLTLDLSTTDDFQPGDLSSETVVLDNPLGDDPDIEVMELSSIEDNQPVDVTVVTTTIPVDDLPLTSDDVAAYYPQHHELNEQGEELGTPVSSVVLPNGCQAETPDISPPTPLGSNETLTELPDSPLSLLDNDDFTDDTWGLTLPTQHSAGNETTGESENFENAGHTFNDDDFLDGSDGFALTLPSVLEPPTPTPVNEGKPATDDLPHWLTEPASPAQPLPELSAETLETSTANGTPEALVTGGSETNCELTESPTEPSVVEEADPLPPQPLFQQAVTEKLTVTVLPADPTTGQVLVQAINNNDTVTLRQLPQGLVPTGVTIRVNKEMDLRTATLYRIEIGRWTGLFAQDNATGGIEFRDELLVGEEMEGVLA